MQLAATRVQFACNWRPLGYNLYATGGHSGTFYMRLAASRMQTFHALAASCVQSRQFFASTLREQFFELKNEDAIKKSENLRDTCACQGLSINTLHGPIQSRATVPLSECALFKKTFCVHVFQSGLNLPTSTVQLEMPLYMFFILWWYLWLSGSEMAFSAVIVLFFT
jgi:hypothetical protein